MSSSTGQTPPLVRLTVLSGVTARLQTPPLVRLAHRPVWCDSWSGSPSCLVWTATDTTPGQAHRPVWCGQLQTPPLVRLTVLSGVDSYRHHPWSGSQSCLVWTAGLQTPPLVRLTVLSGVDSWSTDTSPGQAHRPVWCGQLVYRHQPWSGSPSCLVWTAHLQTPALVRLTVLSVVDSWSTDTSPGQAHRPVWCGQLVYRHHPWSGSPSCLVRTAGLQTPPLVRLTVLSGADSWSTDTTPGQAHRPVWCGQLVNRHHPWSGSPSCLVRTARQQTPPLVRLTVLSGADSWSTDTTPGQAHRPVWCGQLINRHQPWSGSPSCLVRTAGLQTPPLVRLTVLSGADSWSTDTTPGQAHRPVWCGQLVNRHQPWSGSPSCLVRTARQQTPALVRLTVLSGADSSSTDTSPGQAHRPVWCGQLVNRHQPWSGSPSCLVRTARQQTATVRSGPAE